MAEAAMKYYFEEIPMNWITATEKEVERRLYEAELELACKCSPSPAYIEVTMKKTGQKFVVARSRRYQDHRYENPGYVYRIQILTDDCKHIVEDYTYHENEQFPLFTLAVRLIRLNYKYRYFDEI